MSLKGIYVDIVRMQVTISVQSNGKVNFLYQVAPRAASLKIAEEIIPENGKVHGARVFARNTKEIVVEISDATYLTNF